MSTRAVRSDCTGVSKDRLIFKETKCYWKLKISVTYHIFEYDSVGAVELFSHDTSTGFDLNRICFSRAALLGLDSLRRSASDLLEDRMKSLAVIRQKTPGGFFEMEDALIRRDIEDRILGEYITAHVAPVQLSSGAEGIKKRFEIQFNPPDEHDPTILVIFRPPELDGMEPFREIEIQSFERFKPSALKNSVARQRKVAASESVIGAFKGALLSGLMRDFDTSGKKNQASFVSPARRKFQRSVKKIIIQNAVAKVSKMLARQEEERSKGSSRPTEPQRDGGSRPRRRRTLGALVEDQRKSPEKALGGDGEALHASPAAVSATVRPVGRVPAALPPTGARASSRGGRRRVRLGEVQLDSASIEKEVALSESVIQAFHAALVNSLDKDVCGSVKSESYKPSEVAAPPSAAKSRWKKSIKKVMLQKAVAKMTDMLGQSNSEETPQDDDHSPAGEQKTGDRIDRKCDDALRIPDITIGQRSLGTSSPEQVGRLLAPPSTKPASSIDYFGGMFRSRSAAAKAPMKSGILKTTKNALPGTAENARTSSVFAKSNMNKDGQNEVEFETSGLFPIL